MTEQFQQTGFNYEGNAFDGFKDNIVLNTEIRPHTNAAGRAQDIHEEGSDVNKEEDTKTPEIKIKSILNSFVFQRSC